MRFSGVPSPISPVGAHRDAPLRCRYAEHLSPSGVNEPGRIAMRPYGFWLQDADATDVDCDTAAVGIVRASIHLVTRRFFYA